MAPKKRPSKVRPKSPARVRTKKRQRRERAHGNHDLLGLGLLAVGLFLAVVTWLEGNGGIVGTTIADWLDGLFGTARIGVPVVFLVLGALMIARASLVDVKPFRTGLVLVCGGAIMLLGAERGGAFGTGSDAVFGRLIGGTGTFILGLFLVWGGALLLTGASLGAILRRSAGVARDTAGAAKRTVTAVRIPTREDLPWGQTLDEASNGHARPKPPVDGEAAYPDVVGDAPPLQPVLVDQLDSVEAPGLDFALETDDVPEPPTLFDSPSSEQHPAYQLPDANVLRRSRPHESQPGKAAERTAEALLQALANFGIDATLVGQVVGPRVTRYELQLAPGTKVGKVAALKDDLAYALATTEIRILAPIPGKQAVGVEVPNLSPNIVTLGDIFDELPSTASPLSVWLGKDISGASVHADLARMPHILIAGTTGSGKSGCINTMLCSILLRATPDDVRMILVDPKRVELGLYESIPHLLTPVVSSPKQASAVLTNVLTEMERRYERMSLARARNLPELNRALRKRGEATLPYLLVVIDELADLMMVSPQEVEDAVIRLAQKSRAVGIHLVLATQRPVRGRHHRDDQGERPLADRVRGLEPDGQPRHPRHLRRREPARPGRHALQAARHLAPAARPGRLRERGGDRPRRRAVPQPAAAGARRVAARAARGRARGGGRRGLRPRRGSAPRQGDRDRRADADRLGLAPAAAAAGRLHAGGPPGGHAGAPRHHLGVRRLQAAEGPRGRSGARPRARGRRLVAPANEPPCADVLEMGSQEG